MFEIILDPIRQSPPYFVAFAGMFWAWVFTAVYYRIKTGRQERKIEWLWEEAT